MTNVQPLIRIQRASRIFRMGEVEVPALADVDLDISGGELMVILGPSGSGKSTLLNLIGGMDRPSAGHVFYGGVDLSQADDDALTRYRREKVGFVFQFYNLVPTLTAYENVQVATELARDPLEPAEALAMVGMGERAGHFPAQLSGGEQQRVAIARALAKRPELVLADEPTGALDLTAARMVLSTLQDLNRSRNLTVLIITHNPSIGEIADRTVRLVSGRVAELHINEKPIPAMEVEW
ncbi:MAG TPA: ABC transporter ATP-binding protein [Phycisphaerae bacterium]|nr:ABC transporter ATP-binding protein [Phycisphaerae bacterium]HRY70473.1 ABC transporter ATP-binding protein [Phycisphaerae bacterium]HSA27707.1 ABC transporter ATP-binding protein [Phycisphaerae bacterium]